MADDSPLESPKKEPSVRTAALWSMGAQYVAFAITFITSVLISRLFLGPEEVGLFSIALAAAMLVSVLQDFGITRYIAGESEMGPEKLRACFSVSLIVALGIGLVILGLAWPIASFYGDPRLAPIVAVIAGSYLMVPFAIVPSALLQRRMDFRSLFAVNVGGAIVSGATAIALAASGYSAISLAWAAMAQNATRALLGLLLSGAHPTFPLTLKGTKPILGFGGGMSALYISGAIGSRSPDLVVGRIISITATGLYSRASSLAAQLVTLLTGAIGQVFYPAFARMRDRGEALAPPYLRVVAGWTGVVWPAMLMLAVASEPVVLLLYGPAWAGVAPLLTLIALSELFLAAIPLQMELPILLRRMRLLLGLNLIDTAASIGFLALGALWSLEWAAASRILYGAVWWVIYASLLRSLIGLEWRALMDVYARSLAVAVATVVPICLAFRLIAPPAELSLLWLAASVAAGGLMWLGALFAVKHPARLEVVALLEGITAALPFGRTATAR